MGGLPKFRLEMTRHQERVAQSMQDALTALLNGRIAPMAVVPGCLAVTRKQTFSQMRR